MKIINPNNITEKLFVNAFYNLDLKKDSWYKIKFYLRKYEIDKTIPVIPVIENLYKFLNKKELLELYIEMLKDKK